MAKRAPIGLGAEWWVEPMEQAADRDTTDVYEVDVDVLARWQRARTDYLAARAVLVGEIERQGWRASEPTTSFVDIVFTGSPGPEPITLIDIEDEQSHSIPYGQWLKRNDGHWVLRIPRAAA